MADPASVEDLIKASELFGDLTAEEMGRLAPLLKRKTFRSGEILFYEGDPGSHLYLIAEGRVSIGRHSTDGKEAVVALLGPGEVLGELSLLDGEPRSAEARAVEKTTAYVLTEAGLKSLLENAPSVSQALLRVLARRLRRADAAVADAAFLDVPSRVAKQLVDLAERHGSERPTGREIAISLTQEQLASMVGATREGVNRALSALATRGIVSRQGRRYVVHDLDELRRMAGD